MEKFINFSFDIQPKMILSIPGRSHQKGLKNINPKHINDKSSEERMQEIEVKPRKSTQKS